MIHDLLLGLVCSPQTLSNIVKHCSKVEAPEAPEESEITDPGILQAKCKFKYNRADVIQNLGWTIERVLPEEIEEKLSNPEKDYFKNHSATLQVEAEAEIKWLKERCMILESRSNSYVAIGDKTATRTFSEINLDIDEFMYLIGGYDGTQSLSALDAYSPSLDTVKSLQPMYSARSYGVVASLNAEIYIFGGGNGSLCYETVEAYQPANNTWNSPPSLNRLMGSLAGATVNNKLFALGGGNGHESFSDVEMFDLDAGCWIPTQSMLHKRLALAVVEHNGAIYAVGGYDGKSCLNLVLMECLMIGKRIWQ